MKLKTMEPNPAWDPEAHAETVETLAAWRDEVTFRVWGDDGCKDCRSQLPDFGAALEAADVPDERVIHYAVERIPDGTKEGPKVDEYGIGLIPTVVVERDGEEVARFVEEESVPIAEYLAQKLGELEATA